MRDRHIELRVRATIQVAWKTSTCIQYETSYLHLAQQQILIPTS